MLFHVTCSQGRADSLYYESTSKTKILTMLNTLSTAIVRNIKEVVYSKAYNINYVEVPFVPVPTYHKVVILASSKSYAKTFTLYNVKRTVTKELLEIEYKKLFINDEPITDFFDIQFYTNPSLVKNYDNLYQVQYKKDSKTYLEDFYSDDYRKVKNFFEKIIGGELTEIRKFVHHDSTVKKDDGDYVKRVSLFISKDGGAVSTFVPKVNKNINHNVLLDSLQNTLLFQNKPIKKEEIVITYK